MTRKLYLLAWVCASLLVTPLAWAQNTKLFVPYTPAEAQKKELDKGCTSYQLLRPDVVKWRQLMQALPTQLVLEIPTQEGNLVADLHAAEILTPGFKAQEQTAEGVRDLNLPNGLLLQGHLRGLAKSHIALSIFPNGQIMGVAWAPSFSGNYVIGRVGGITPNIMEQPIVVYNDRDLLAKNPFKCETDEIADKVGEDHAKANTPNNGQDQITNTCRYVTNRWIAGTTMYQALSSNSVATSNHLIAVFNVVNQLYNIERVHHRLDVTTVNTTADGIRVDNSGNCLNDFRAFIAGQGSLTQNLAHYFTANQGLGGRAYLNTTCEQSFFEYRTGMSDLDLDVTNLPTYSWDVEVTTHELGHNLGSNHTQWCGWQKSPGVFGMIDSCYAAEARSGFAVCYTGPVVPRVGTIMSYCHLTVAGIDLNLGFGTLPGAVIRNTFNNGTCLAGSSAVPTMTLTAPASSCPGNTVNLSITPITNATYQWVGPDNFTATTASTSVSNFSAAKAGSYFVRVTVNGCTYISAPKVVELSCLEITSIPTTICQGSQMPLQAILNLTPNAGTQIRVRSASSTNFSSFSNVLATFNGVNSINGNINTSSLAAGSYRIEVIATHDGQTYRALAPLPLAVNAVTSAATSPAAQQLCGSGSATLTGSGSGFQHRWVRSGSDVSTSNSYNTPTLTTTTTFQYFRTAVNTGTMGMATTTGGNIRSVVSSWGNILRVSKVCTLNSVLVNAGTAGTVGITVLDSASFASVRSGTFSVTAGISTISNIGFVLQPGVYILSPQGTTVDLYRTNTGGGYPYRIAGVAEMLGTWNGVELSTSFYYWFYNLGITHNSCESSAANYEVQVNTPPSTPTVTAGGPTTFCSGGSVVLTSSAGTSYLWSNNATTQSITITTAGTYSVRTIANGCTSATSNTITVTVNSAPSTPTVTAGGPTTFCSGGSVVLTSSAGTSYLWSNNATTQSITATTAGTYSVRTIANGCTSSTSNTITVTVNSAPSTPTVTAGGPTTFCSGGSVVLTSSAGTSYLWSNNATTQSITVTSAGTYSVRTIANGCTSATSNTITVTVNSAPSTPTVTAGGPTTFCSGGSVVLTSSAGTSYLWSNNATTQSITVTTAGTYSVRTIANGCTSATSNTITVTVNSAPSTPTVTAGGPTTFCSGGSVVLTSSAGTSYLWSNNATTQSITVTTAGTYSVRIIANGCTSATSNTITVTVNSAPSTPTVSASGPTNFSTGGSVVLTAPAGFSYLWSTNETTRSITVTSGGSYTVRTIANGCTSAASSPIIVTVTAATTYIWNGTGTDGTSANWSNGGIPPGTADSVVINSGTMTLTADRHFKRLSVRNAARVMLNGFVLTSDEIVRNDGGIEGLGTFRIFGDRLYGSGVTTVGIFAYNTLGTMHIEQRVRVLEQLQSQGNTVIHPTLGRIELASSATKQAILSPAATGTFTNPERFTFERYIAPTGTNGAWFHIGPPVENYTVGGLAANNPFAMGTYDNTIPNASSLYFYDPTDTRWPTNQGYVKASAHNQVFNEYQGARVWMRRSALQAGPLLFRGHPRMNVVSFTLKYCASGCTYGTENGYNLIRNPFPAWLDWDAHGWLRNQVAGQIHVWNAAMGQFASYNAGVGVNGGSNMIAPGQAFFVTARSSAAQILVSRGATTEQTSPSFLRSASVPNVLKIAVSQQSNLLDEAAIRLEPTATGQYDPAWDALNMGGEGADISTLSAHGEAMAINALPYHDGLVVPIKLANAQAGMVLSVSGVESLDAGIVAYWQHPTFTQPLPVSGTPLVLTSALLQDLTLVFRSTVTSLGTVAKPQLVLYPNPAEQELKVSVYHASATSIELLDVLGRVVLSQDLASGTSNHINLSGVSQGTYVAKVFTAQGVLQQKVVVRK